MASGSTSTAKRTSPRASGRLRQASSTAILKAGQLEVMRIVLLAGKSMPEHMTRGEATVQCIEGEIEFQGHSGAQRMHPGIGAPSAHQRHVVTGHPGDGAAQVAFAWLLSKPYMAAPIMGADGMLGVISVLLIRLLNVA